MPEYCPVCNTENVLITPDGSRTISIISCLRCGKFKITNSLEGEISKRIGEKGYIVSGSIREANEMNLPLIELSTYNIDSYITEDHLPPNLTEKLNKILLYLARKTKIVGSFTDITPNESSIVYAVNKEEFLYMLRLLKDMSLLEFHHENNEGNWRSSIPIRLSIKGWERVDELRARNPIKGNQCFVAMWFDDSLNDAWNKGFKMGIEDAGYSALKISMLQHNDQISDRIISEIRQSRILVADFTGQRGGVYFEAGFAMGLNKIVIWTCREDDIDKCHFDTRQYNHIVWKAPDDLRESLKDRILATAPVK